MGKYVYRERVLTVCRWGLVRSVALRRTLIDELGVDSIACGVERNSRATLRMLGEWADIIVISSEHLMQLAKVDEFPRGKIRLLDMGHDRWQNPRHKDLEDLSRRLLAPVMADIRKMRKAMQPRSSKLRE